MALWVWVVTIPLVTSEFVLRYLIDVTSYFPSWFAVQQIPQLIGSCIHHPTVFDHACNTQHRHVLVRLALHYPPRKSQLITPARTMTLSLHLPSESWEKHFCGTVQLQISAWNLAAGLVTWVILNSPSPTSNCQQVQSRCLQLPYSDVIMLLKSGIPESLCRFLGVHSWVRIKANQAKEGCGSRVVLLKYAICIYTYVSWYVPCQVFKC